MIKQNSNSRSACTYFDQHKKSSVIIIAVVALLFGLFMSFSMIIAGLERSLIAASVANFDGKTYLSVQLGKYTYGDEDLEGSNPEVTDIITQNHGTILGTINRGAFPFIDLEVVKDYVSLQNSDKLPVLGKAWQISENTSIYDADTMYLAGSVEGIDPSYSSKPLSLSKPSLLNSLLKPISHPFPVFALINDHSSEFQNYLEKAELLRGTELDQIDSDSDQPETKISQALAISFDNPEDAYRCYTMIRKQDPEHNYYVSALFSNTIDILENFATLRSMTTLLEIVVFVALALGLALAFRHQLSQQGKKLSCNFSSFLLYLLILSVLACIFSTAIALVLDALMLALDKNALAELLQDYYLLTSAPRIHLIGLNFNFLLSILLIFALISTITAFTYQYFAKSKKTKR